MKNIPSLLMLLLVGLFTMPVITMAQSIPERLLFIGNSYLYYNDSLHNHVRRMLEEQRPELTEQLIFKSATIGGARLKHHNIEWLLDHQKIGVKKPFDVVVIQGGSREVIDDSSATNYQQLVKSYSELIREQGAIPYLYMTPAYVPPHAGARPGLIEVIEQNTMRAAQVAGVRVIPVGLAFDEAYKRKPNIELHKAFDGTHPSLHGTYLAACVVYLTIYGGSIDELQYDYFGAIEQGMAEFLRDVATDVYMEFQTIK